MDINITALRQHQRPLQTRHTQLTAELDQLVGRRARLLRQGRTAVSPTQQRVLARQVQTAQRQIAALRQQLHRVAQQLELINRLLLAQEMAYLLPPAQRHTLWPQLDWPATPDAAHLLKLAAVVERLETAVLHHLPPPNPPHPSTPNLQSPISFFVERIIDGDTILIAGGERVRYIGIDCPEMVGLDGQPEAYAQQATERNRQLVAGQIVRLVRDVSDRDRYGRLLRYVYVGDCLINAQLVREGLAYVLTLPPDVAHAPRLARLEAEAQRRKRGIWNSL